MSNELSGARVSLRFAIWPDGTVEHAALGDTWLNLFPGSPVEGGGWNLWLRRLDGAGPSALEWAPLLGPHSPLRTVAIGEREVASCGLARATHVEVDGDGNAPTILMQREGSALGVAIRLALIADPARQMWCWRVQMGDDRSGGRQGAPTSGDDAPRWDIVLSQDLGLTSAGAARTNEYYVSQYIDFQPLDDGAFGTTMAVRQNQSVGGRYPWLLAGATRRVVSFATDAWQWHGVATRGGIAPPALREGLPGHRLQQEQALLALQVEPFTLSSAQPLEIGFWSLARADHPAPSGPEDLAMAAVARASPGWQLALAAPPGGLRSARSLAAMPPQVSRSAQADRSWFTEAPLLSSPSLEEADLQALFGDSSRWRHVERDARGRLLSFHTDAATHVVTRDKALLARRPHGHILRSGAHLVPDESALTSTVWMAGVFHSMLTQGHVSINRLFSTVRGFDAQFRSQGLRLFVAPGGEDGSPAWQLLDLPSAFEMRPAGCRWLYSVGGGLLAVSAQASDPAPWRRAAADRVSGSGGSGDVAAGPPAAASPASGESVSAASSLPVGTMDLQVRWLRPPVSKEWLALRVRVSLHLALDGDDGRSGEPVRSQLGRERIELAPPAGSGLAQRFPDGRFIIRPLPGTSWSGVGDDAGVMVDGALRGLPFVTIDGIVDAGSRPVFGLVIQGDLVRVASPASDAALLPRLLPGRAAPTGDTLTTSPTDDAAANARIPLPPAWSRLADILPWFHHNALVHYLSPRGLEQFSGGGWGTRDVTQGPLELLLALDRSAPARDLLLRTFAAQNADGDWPQWFMFFERERTIRPADSHGDIVFWPVLALARYLRASGDASILDAAVPYFDASPTPLRTHVERALAVMRDRRIAGTMLPAYGHGDWNDSLQPADPALRDHLCSAWTTTLCRETLSTLADALDELNILPDWVPALRRWAEGVQHDFQKLLLPDGVIPGYLLFEPGSQPRPLLHPRDQTTGLRYSALAMFHAILADMLTPAQARAHLDLIAEHLSGVDGVRLFDQPLPYRGGAMCLFQRAETATYFGREIGLMYMHAQVRYAQALAHVGEVAAFVAALERLNPIAIGQVVRGATPRQSNCYYSSSDAAFADRMDASAHYEKVRDGSVSLDGGWRIYSSGPGIAIGAIVGQFLGIRRRWNGWEFDPVMTPAYDGAQVQIELSGRPALLTVRVGERGCGVTRIDCNGLTLAFERVGNPYRVGAAFVSDAVLASLGAVGSTPDDPAWRVTVHLG